MTATQPGVGNKFPTRISKPSEQSQLSPATNTEIIQDSIISSSSESSKSREQVPDPSEPSWSFWTVFSSTFITIFLAEMGDKTQLATLLISAESQSPWLVFAGAATALIATSLLGVIIGYWIARRLSPKTLDLAVAILLLIITGLLIGDVLSA